MCEGAPRRRRRRECDGAGAQQQRKCPTPNAFLEIDTDFSIAQSMTYAAHLAARFGHADTLRFLIDRGAAVDHRDFVRLNLTKALHLAYRHEVIFKQTSGVSCPLQAGCTALLEAAERGHLPCVDLLLYAGANKETVNKARRASSAPVLSALLTHFVRAPSAISAEVFSHTHANAQLGFSALLAAVSRHHEATALRLVAAGAQTEHRARVRAV